MHALAIGALISIPILTYLVFRWQRSLLRTRAASVSVTSALDESIYNRDATRLHGLVLVAAVPLFIAGFAALRGGAGLQRTADGLVIYAEPILWGLPTMPIVVLVVQIVQDAFFSRRFPSEYGALVEGAATIKGPSVLLLSDRTARWICLAGFLILAAFVLWAAEFAREEMKFRNPPWVTSSVYSYDQVDSIHLAPAYENPLNGRTVKSPTVVVGFIDGDSWNSQDGPSELTPAEARRVADFVSRASGVPVDRIETIPR